MSGLILKPGDLKHDDLSEFGRITIERVGFDVHITVDGFAFNDASTGRIHVTKALAWARDVLAAKIEAQRLVPGGGVVAIFGVPQSELEPPKS